MEHMKYKLDTDFIKLMYENGYARMCKQCRDLAFVSEKNLDLGKSIRSETLGKKKEQEKKCSQFSDLFRVAPRLLRFRSQLICYFSGNGVCTM